MIKLKKIKLGIFTLSTAVLATFAFPQIQSNAAPSSMDLVYRMYQQIAGQKLTTTPSYTTPTKTAPTKPSTTKPTQSTPAPAKPTTGGTATNQSSVALANRIIATGEKYLGTPYRYGASSGQTRTFDCSSFTQYVYKVNGISLLRSSRQQYTQGTSVSRSQLQKGDLIFFTTSKSGGKIGHVGIYAGNNKLLHTWGPGGVRYDSLDTGWLKRGYVGAKRVIK